MSFLIIGGTEKAGTTSVFEYLAVHPQVRPSIRKETDYFRQAECNKQEYCGLFFQGAPENICVEASPGYLGLASEVAPRIHTTLTECQLVFILRDPVERFQSSYRFHRSKFFIPDWLSIDAYTDMCLSYDRGDISLSDTPFTNAWFMQVLPAGRYARHLKHYFERFDEQVTLVDFDQLNSDPGRVMQRICRNSGIDASFYQDFDYFRSNSTFHGKVKAVHALGMKVNDALEPVLRRHPRLKRQIVSMYRTLNGAGMPEGATLSTNSVAKLTDYYRSDVDQVTSLFQQTQQQPVKWRHFHAA
ncbi:sulfotransferase family protein [Haliea sp. E17]|uniref:sulfotransferase family protein n=1 Tax=Haliea sp. E17 TaxID=3401576 RepID=UPI003AAF66EA